MLLQILKAYAEIVGKHFDIKLFMALSIVGYRYFFENVVGHFQDYRDEVYLIKYPYLTN